MIRLICLFMGYVFGLFQTAFFYGKLHGIDIRTMGSGNAGTTNTLRVLGTKAGIIVLIGDILKTVIAIALTRFLVVPQAPGMEYLLIMYTAAGAILGHNFPFYMGFRGGKGIAATAGLVFSFHPWFAVVTLVVFLGTFLCTHYVSLGSLLVYAAFVIQLVIMGESGMLGELALIFRVEMYVLALLLLVMAYWKHRDNISRLLTHTERKTYLLKKKDDKND